MEGSRKILKILRTINKETQERVGAGIFTGAGGMFGAGDAVAGTRTNTLSLLAMVFMDISVGIISTEICLGAGTGRTGIGSEFWSGRFLKSVSTFLAVSTVPPAALGGFTFTLETKEFEGREDFTDILKQHVK